jgi:hypothetical protein
MVRGRPSPPGCRFGNGNERWVFRSVTDRRAIQSLVEERFVEQSVAHSKKRAGNDSIITKRQLRFQS